MTTIAPTSNTLAKRKQRESPEYRALEASRRKRYRVKEYEASWRRRSCAETWPVTRIPYLRHKAKTRGLDFNIDASDISVPEFCPILGIKLVSIRGANGRKNPAAPSVDRVDNTLGYVKGNVRVISNRANYLKSDGTAEELEAIAKYMKGDT